MPVLCPILFPIFQIDCQQNQLKGSDICLTIPGVVCTLSSKLVWSNVQPQPGPQAGACRGRPPCPASDARREQNRPPGSLRHPPPRQVPRDAGRAADNFRAFFREPSRARVALARCILKGERNVSLLYRNAASETREVRRRRRLLCSPQRFL